MIHILVNVSSEEEASAILNVLRLAEEEGELDFPFEVIKTETGKDADDES